MGKNNNYTIIIPHHNIPNLLERCLSSIPIREDIQVIVIDDKSDEKNVSRLHNLQNKFPNVEFVYSKVNGYGGYARNIGLSKANGKYVIFADADDFFNLNLTQILDDYKDSLYDIVFFKVKKIDDNTCREISIPHYVNSYIDLWDTDKKTADLYLRYIWGEPWGKLIRRDLIENFHIRFDEIRINNDTTFSYLVGHNAKTIQIDKRFLYTYAIQKYSTSRQKDINRLYIKIDVFGRSELFFRNHNIPLHEYRYLNSLSYFLKYFSFSGFRKGFLQIVSMGFTPEETRKKYAEAISFRSFIAPIWSFLFAPDIKIKVYCIGAWFRISWPRFIKYKVLRRKNRELKIS